MRIRYTDVVTPQETARAVERCELLLSKLKPGFRLLTDLSSLVSMDLGCAPHIRMVMDQCNKHGVELIVRVVPDPAKDIGFNIMSHFHYSRHVQIVTCETMEEAARALAA